MSTASTLKEVLAVHGLSEQSLKRKLSRDYRKQFTNRVGEWKALGSVIGFTQEQITTIDDEYENEEQKKTTLFIQWTDRHGEEATYLKLAELLFAGELRDLLNDLCSIMSPSISAVSG